MALMTCSECGKQFSDSARACPACGWRRPRNIERWLMTGIFLGSLVLIWGASMGNANDRVRERAAISSCWGTQVTLSAENAAGMAASCEALERRFVAKWGSRP